MKNMQPTTPGFVLTSLSFSKAEKKKTTQPNWHQNSHDSQSSIAKFDYCLPPDEFNYSDGIDSLNNVA